MRTEDLLAGLAKDAAVTRPTSDRSMALFAALAFVAAAPVLAIIRPRADLLAALSTPLFLVKMAVVVAFAAGLFALARAIVRPGSELPIVGVLVPVAALGVALGIDLVTATPGTAAARLVGTNWAACLTLIPTMAALPLVILIGAMRRGAPTNATKAGAVAGLFAGALAAVFYGIHCTDDAPAFVLTWYGLAIGFVTGVGALIGSRVLRW